MAATAPGADSTATDTGAGPLPERVTVVRVTVTVSPVAKVPVNFDEAKRLSRIDALPDCWGLIAPVLSQTLAAGDGAPVHDGEQLTAKDRLDVVVLPNVAPGIATARIDGVLTFWLTVKASVNVVAAFFVSDTPVRVALVVAPAVGPPTTATVPPRRSRAAALDPQRGPQRSCVLGIVGLPRRAAGPSEARRQREVGPGG